MGVSPSRSLGKKKRKKKQVMWIEKRKKNISIYMYDKKKKTAVYILKMHLIEYLETSA